MQYFMSAILMIINSPRTWITSFQTMKAFHQYNHRLDEYTLLLQAFAEINQK